MKHSNDNKLTALLVKQSYKKSSIQNVVNKYMDCQILFVFVFLKHQFC